MKAAAQTDGHLAGPEVDNPGASNPDVADPAAGSGAVEALTEAIAAAAWAEMQALVEWRREHGHFDRHRAEQAQSWFLAEVRAGLLARLSQEPAATLLQSLGAEVAMGHADPVAAAADMLESLR